MSKILPKITKIKLYKKLLKAHNYNKNYSIQNRLNLKVKLKKIKKINKNKHSSNNLTELNP